MITENIKQMSLHEKWEVMATMKFTFEELLKILEQTDQSIIFPPDTVWALFAKYTQTKDSDDV